MKTTKKDLYNKHPLKLPDDRKLTFAERKQQLMDARFIDVRTLVHNIYETQDGKPLLSYRETLDNRDNVYNVILQYELADGDILADGTERQFIQNVVVEQPTQPQGEQQMAASFQPGVPPPATVAQAVAAGQEEPSEQPMPQAPAGRARRRPGAAVAPPPVASNAPVAGVASFQPPAAPQPQAQTQQAPVAFGAPAGGPTAFAVPQQGSVQPNPAPTGAGPMGHQGGAPAVGLDLTPVIDRIDAVGKLLADVGNLDGKIEEKVNALAANLNKEVENIKTLLIQTLTAVHHLYLSNPATAQNTQNKANTLPEFQSYLAQFYQGVPR